MADDAVKTLIAKLNLDGSSIAAVVQDFRSQLAAIAASSAQQAAQSQAANTAVVSGIKEQVAATKEVTAAVQATTQAAVSGANQQKAASAAMYQAELENLKKRGELLDIQNEKVKVSIELMKERAKESAKEEEGLSVRGIAGAIGEGALGGGVVGSTLSGLLKGAGLTLGIEAAYEGMSKLTEKVKEFIEDSGGLQKVTDTFQKLSAGVGSNPTEFLEKLRSATHDLVNDVDLLRSANAFMQSGLKLSSEDMVKLTEATVGLARAQGNDANQAVQQLTRSFLSGRSSQLGYSTGIQKTLLSITGLGTTLSAQQKANLSFAQTISLIEQRYEELGQPMLTYTDRLKQMSVVQGRLFESLAQGTVTSGGFTAFMNQLGKIIERLGGMEGIANKVGTAIGNAFQIVATALEHIPEDLKTIKELFDQVQIAATKLSDALNEDFGKKGAADDPFAAMHPVLNTLIVLWANLSGAIRMAAVDLQVFTGLSEAFDKQETKLFKDVGQNVTKGVKQIGSGDIASGYRNIFGHFGEAPTNVSDLVKSGDTKVKEIQADIDRQIAAAREQVAADDEWDSTYRGGSVGSATGGKDVPDPGLARRAALANAKAAMDEKVAAAKEALAKIKELLEDESEANEKMYKEEGETAAQYYARKDEIATASYLATVSELEKERDARLTDLKVELQQNALFKPQYDSEVKKAQDQYNRGIDEAYRTRNKSVASDQQGLFADSKAQINKTADEQLEIQKDALKEQVEATKNAFAQNAIDANQYHQERIQEIYDELQAVEDAEAKKQATMTATEKVASAGRILVARQLALGQLQQRSEQEPGEILNNIQAGYTTRLGVNAAQQNVAAANGTADGANAYQLKLQQAQILQEQVNDLTHQMSLMTVKVGEDWDKINVAMQRAKATLGEIKNQLEDEGSATTQLGGLGGAIGAAGTGLFTGTFGRGFISSFSQGAAVLAGSTKASQQWSGDAADSSGSGATNFFSAFKDSISDVIGGNGSDGLQELTKSLSGAATAVGSFAKVIASATSPLGGAFGGAQAGAGLGQSLGLGPLGALGGAAGGAVLGAIVGQKQQEVQQDIVNIQLAARQMQEAFSAGSASLNSTITTLQGLITTLTKEQSSSKKGSSQFQDLINQYNQQLSQLEAQQTQVIQQMTQQLASVSSPEAYQQWIQNIDSVIQQYAQFAGAAQNATQLAQANEYLTSSLQNIGQQMGDQLMQEEESAIQNALQLNQLYNQRNQLELEYLNQVQSIMSQGNVTRQRTQAQSAFSQLYDAQVNYSQQLDSINQQINLAQYQLNVEQQIFNLATTKAGLESQLLSLQEQGVNEDMQRIVAMQNLLQTLQSTGYSITNLSSLSANDPNALQNTLLQDLINELGTGQGTMIQQLTTLINVLTEYGGLPSVAGSPATPNVSSTVGTNPNVATDMLSALYQSRAQFGYGAYRAQNL